MNYSSKRSGFPRFSLYFCGVIEKDERLFSVISECCLRDGSLPPAGLLHRHTYVYLLYRQHPRGGGIDDEGSVARSGAGDADGGTNIASSLASNYSDIGINRGNTSFSFLEGNKFSAKVNGIPFSGTYTYNPQNGEISLKTATETIKGNVTKTEKGMGLMFDSSQMTNILQKEGKVSNTEAVHAVSKLARSANGARVGFELTK